MTARLDDLKAWAADFKRSARGAEYLTEVSLGRDELQSLLALLSRFRRRLDESDDFAFALAVAAVNFAYYQESDDGFREPFTKHLAGSADATWFDRAVGPMIEATIVAWNGTSPREGPYRYVGLVREHAGLPFWCIRQFAKLLDALRHDPGWPAAGACRSQKLLDAVRAHFRGSRYGEEFLSKPQGIGFIRSVCGTLNLHYAGCLDSAELGNLPGYRTGFIPLLVRELEAFSPGGKSKPAGSAAGADPRLVLDPDACRLYLRFDPVEVSRGRIDCQQFPGPLYQSRVPVGPGLEPSARYFGMRRADGGDEPWECSGWRPRPGNWAVFGADGVLLACRDDDEPVPAGEYHLAADDSVCLPPESVTGRFGALDFDGLDLGAYYALYSVRLESDMTLPGRACIAAAAPDAPRLVAVGAEIWSAASEVDAVWSCPAPLVKVLHWTPENSRRFLLMFDDGTGSRRLHVPAAAPNAEDPTTASLSFDGLPVPSIGRLWLVPAGRSRGVPTSQLTFARWPQCRVTVPDGLHPDSAEPEFRLELPAGVTAECDTCHLSSRRDGVRHVLHFRAAAGVEAVSLTLGCGGQSLGVRVVVRRARFRHAQTPREPLFLEPAALARMRAEHLRGEGGGAFQVTALPHAEAALLLRAAGPSGGGGATELTRLKMSPAGTGLLLANQMADSLSEAGTTIGRFEVTVGAGKDGGSAGGVPTDSWFIDIDRLAREGGIDKAVAEASAAGMEPPPPLAEGFALIASAKAGSAKPLSADLARVEPAGLRRTAANWAYASHVLDRRPLAEGMTQADRSADPEVRQAVDAVSSLLGAVQQLDPRAAPEVAAGLLAAFDDRAPADLLRRVGLELPRWEVDLTVVRGKLQSITATHDRLARLVAACHRREADADIPALLFNGCLDYARAEGAYGASAVGFLEGAAHKLLAGSFDPFWNDVAAVLRPLAFLRLCRVSAFVKAVLDGPPPQRTAPAWAELHAMAENLRHKRIGNGGEGEAGAADTPMSLSRISPRGDDRCIAAGLAGGFEPWLEVSRHCWVGAWLGWRWGVMSQQPSKSRKNLYDAIRRQSANIPPSLDREEIVREVESGVLRAWGE